jgi:K+-transporting ATPase A subunit
MRAPRPPNHGPQGLADAFYADSSRWNDTRSATAGYGATELSGTLGGIAMPLGAGTLRPTPSTFGATLIFGVVLIAALNILPALALGPLAAELSGLPV